MAITPARLEALPAILALQRLAYQSEARLLNDNNIPPLRQTLDDLERELRTGTILKLTDDDGTILGSVRGHAQGEVFHIGKLMVHPAHQGKGYGSRLLAAMERASGMAQFELFTSDKSVRNIRLYERAGYVRVREEWVSPSLRFVFLQKKSELEPIIQNTF